MKGSLPEVSISVGFIISPHLAAIALPVGTLPVKATMLVRGCSTSCRPASPAPVSTWNKPGGRWRLKGSANSSVVIVVYSEGLAMTALPQASAAAPSQASNVIG
jgi:hypothetical protein